MLANGNIVESIGCITTRCSFEIDGSDPAEAITCIFHVLLKFAAPLIVGMAFLEETKTLIEHRERLVRFPRPAIQALNVYSVGRPRKQLHCRLNENSVLATPDTGSEVDLMSPRFALERGLFTIRGSGEMIEFADGSVALTSGIVQATLQVIGGGNINSSIQSTISVEYLLLDTLVHDVLIGEDSLEELRVFTQNQNSLYPVSDMTGPLGLNSIRYLGAIDRTLKWVREKLAVKTQESQIISQYPNFSLLTTCSLLTHSLDPVSSRFHKDQQENSRREYEATRIACFPEDERRSAIATEAERQAQYDYTPYYCPVSGCLREQSGQGFQSWDEMMDHLDNFHDTHHACPFYTEAARFFTDVDAFYKYACVSWNLISQITKYHRHMRADHKEKVKQFKIGFVSIT